MDRLSSLAAGERQTLARVVADSAQGAAWHEEAPRNARLNTVLDHIRRELHCPALSPVTAAASLGISLRTLHDVFRPMGTSFGRHVRAARLEHCRQALLANPRRPVADICREAGFRSLSSFYRAFHDAFGISPNHLRAEADPEESAGARLQSGR